MQARRGVQPRQLRSQAVGHAAGHVRQGGALDSLGLKGMDAHVGIDFITCFLMCIRIRAGAPVNLTRALLMQGPTQNGCGDLRFTDCDFDGLWIAVFSQRSLPPSDSIGRG